MTTYKERELQKRAHTFVATSLAILQRDGVPGQDDDGSHKVSAYIGDYCNITPSGKCYAVFAASYVNTCELCNETGEIPNPNYDPDVFAMAEECHMDLSARLTKCRCSDVPAIKNNMFDNLHAAFAAVVLAKQQTAKTMMCPYCGGYGSRDVYLDELFWGEVNRQCAANNVTIFIADGSGIDVVIVRYLETVE